ncbi:MAG TPA: cytochrome c [Steroidobacteraceae bacterium]|jgi:cytochrome c556|nr:cytochrome c [Steroidobacteraceae bacterium]
MADFRSSFAVRTTVLCGTALIALLTMYSIATLAQDKPPSKAEQAIKYRQSVYKVILWNFGPMHGMAEGKIPYDATDFAKRAERVATMAPMLLEGYPPGSNTDAPTRAKPEIWQNFDEFSKLMHNMEDKAAALASVAKEGSLDKSRAAANELGDACKACHDKFRAEKPS